MDRCYYFRHIFDDALTPNCFNFRMKNVTLLVHSAEQSCLETLGLEGDDVKVRKLFCICVLFFFSLFPIPLRLFSL